MRNKILIDTRMLSGPVHGIARYAYWVATGVARLRPDWTIGVWTHESQIWKNSPHSNIIPVPIQGHPFSLREQWELPVSAFSFRADLVHFCSIAVPLWLPRRSVATVHDLIPLHFPRSGIHSLILRHFTGAILKRVSRIVCVSRYTCQDVQTHLGIQPGKMQLIYNGGLDGKIGGDESRLPPANVVLGGTACPPRPPANVPQKPYFLCVSNPKPHKNLALLLEAFRPLENDYDLILVSPAAAWLDSALVGRIGIRRIHGLTDVEMTRLYHQALGVVLPSLYEGFGIPALEAMQLGVPVISSRATSLPEVVGDAGLLFDPRNPDELTQHLESLARDAELRKDLRQRGLLQAEKFSWDKCARQHAELFEKMLQNA